MRLFCKAARKGTVSHSISAIKQNDDHKVRILSTYSQVCKYVFETGGTDDVIADG